MAEVRAWLAGLSAGRAEGRETLSNPGEDVQSVNPDKRADTLSSTPGVASPGALTYPLPEGWHWEKSDNGHEGHHLDGPPDDDNEDGWRLMVWPDGSIVTVGYVPRAGWLYAFARAGLLPPTGDTT
jgi:hypothetical protein